MHQVTEWTSHAKGLASWLLCSSWLLRFGIITVNCLVAHATDAFQNTFIGVIDVKKLEECGESQVAAVIVGHKGASRATTVIPNG